jgi:GNAT superfamily N-acetyltransferase
VEVRPLADEDRPWVAEVCRRRFGAETVAARGRLHRPAGLPGLVAWEQGRRAGALCFCEEPGGAELVLLVGEPPGRGAGSALLEALAALGMERGWPRLRLLVTNDNTVALRFYQRRGWELVALHAGEVDRDRELKPEIPERGLDGIPIRHLLELHRGLSPAGEGP